MKKRILVVEDDEALGWMLCENFTFEGFDVRRAADVVILDLMLPKLSGLDVCRRLRRDGSAVPIIMLTARGEESDRIRGLDTGADDYLTKPFSMMELLARLRAVMRRIRPSLAEDIVTVGDIEMDRAAHRVTVAGRDLELSPKEFALLEYFLTHKDQAVSRAELADHVWDDSFDSLANVVDVTIHRLRKKIDGERGDRLLHTLKGVGYVLKSRRE
jgi:two-component system phosphate regulon response regulator PhoB